MGEREEVRSENGTPFTSHLSPLLRGIPRLERLDFVSDEISEDVTMLEPADQLRLVEERAHHFIGHPPQELGIAGEKLGVELRALFEEHR